MVKKKARRPANIPEKETKAERFERVVKPRVAKAIKRIEQIGFCAGAAYESTPEQVAQICTALINSVSNMSDKYKAKTKQDTTFDFMP